MRWWLGAFLLAGVCGCGGTATVTGKVSYQGRTVTYGSVLILGSDKKTRFGVIQPDGSYTVEGVTPGAVKIGVISRDPAKPASKVPASARATPTWFPLPPKFEDPATSGIVGTVGSGRVKHDIDLPAGDGS